MLKKMIFLVALTLMVGVATFTGIPESSAGVVTIHADQLVPDVGTTSSFQNPGNLKGTGGYYKVIHLPAGKRVKRLLVTCSGAPAGFTFDAALLRKKAGEQTQTVVEYTHTGITDESVHTESSVPTDVTARDRIVSRYRYFVAINPRNLNGLIYDMRVIYA